MLPLLTLALALISNAVDLARVFVGPSPDHAPVTFYFQKRHEERTFDLLAEDGNVRSEMIKPFSYFVRCWRTQKVKSMHPRTLEVVAAISRHFGDAKVEVVSGYRARPYGAPHSKHFLGRAMDVHVEGVPARQVAAWVWKNFRRVGVGLYPSQDFVHVDTREEDVRWTDHSRHGESAGARYFGRMPADMELPLDAPRLAYDAPKAPAATNVAAVTLK
jgi:uncharacterized protein YcbK (DUF882 family)